jgi:hypothetical protein
MSLSDVNQLALAILSGAGSRRATPLIKIELKHARRHANNTTSLYAWDCHANGLVVPRTGRRRRAGDGLAAHVAQDAARKPRAARRAFASDTSRAERHGRAPVESDAPRHDVAGEPREQTASGAAAGKPHGRAARASRAERCRGQATRVSRVSRPREQGGCATTAPGQGRGRGGGKPRWAELHRGGAGEVASGRQGRAAVYAGRGHARTCRRARRGEDGAAQGSEPLDGRGAARARDGGEVARAGRHGYGSRAELHAAPGRAGERAEAVGGPRAVRRTGAGHRGRTVPRPGGGRAAAPQRRARAP